ncbi:MAG: metal ABC transporter permease [Thermodesulfobacteriota bacterium]
MLEALGFDFMRNAVLAGLLCSLACGVIGTYVVVNRIVFLSGGIAHAAYGGVGLAIFLGLAPLWGIIGVTLTAALVMAAVSLKAKHRADTVIGVIWATGMALGVLLLDVTPGYNADLMSYLFGSILTVPVSQLWMMLVMDLVIVLTVGYFYHDLAALSFDEEFAQVRGVPVKRLYYLLMALIALSVVMIIQVVGLILVIALLTIPPYIAEKFAGSLFRMMLVSIGLNLVFTVSGLWLSYSFNLTSGASIIMVAAAAFFLVHLAGRLWPAGKPRAAGEGS